MARATAGGTFAEKLKKALKTELKNVGIDSKVDYEKVPHTKLYRFIVLASGFQAMWHSERQSMVWRIAERTLSEPEQLQISGILTMTPDEFNGK